MRKTIRKRKKPEVVPAKLEKLIEKGMGSPDFKEGYEAASQIIAVGELIRSIRLGSRMTQAELAEKADMTQTEISRIESGLGKQGPTYLTLLRLSQALREDLFAQISKKTKPAKPVESKELLEAR